MQPLVLTGSTGLLGRAIATRLAASSTGNHRVSKWSHSRGSEPEFKRVNLTDENEVKKALEEIEPWAVVHSAAERRPDVVSGSGGAAQRLNVSATQVLAEWCCKNDALLIYISTDYVFDGTAPPYKPEDTPQPLNEYGKQKLEGERLVQKLCPRNLILRVPILYGPVEYLGEGAVDIILKGMQEASLTKPVKMSHYERRYPTHVADVAKAVDLLLQKGAQDRTLTGTYHWSGCEEMTKWDMCQTMARVLGLAIDPRALVPDPSQPSGGTTRPYNSQLDPTKLREMGMENDFRFEKGVECLRPFVKLEK